MRVLVTGYKGFIGSHLMKALEDMEVERFTQEDIHTTIPPMDVYIHLAAQPSVPYSIDHPQETYRTNLIGTLNVLEACRKNKAKIVFTSSSQASPEALNPYALQKHQCEELIRLYSKLYNIHYCILRLYNVFGKGGHGVIETYLKAKDKPLEVWGGFQSRDFVHVDTVVSELIRGIEDEGTFEVGSGVTHTIQEIADMISPNQVLMPLTAGQPMETRCPTPVPTMSVEEYIETSRVR